MFSERIDALVARATASAGAPDARAALLEWLGALTAYASSARGLAEALTLAGTDDPDHAPACCSAKLAGAADPLLQRAAQAGAVAPGVTAADLVTLVTGIVLATEHHQDPAAEANRLLDLTLRGVVPQG